MPDFWLGDAGVRDPAVNHFGWTRLKIRLIIQRFQGAFGNNQKRL
jgi:hypothetical protein